MLFVIQRKIQMLYNKGLQANFRVKGETMVQKAHSYQKQSGTVSITLSLALSIDEKSSSVGTG